ncbi:MAG: flippase [Candidatus Woesearchaeota archaeon]
MNAEYKKRAISGFFWHFLMMFISAPLSYLVRIIYDRNIPIVEIGLFYATLDLLGIIAVVRELGLSNSLIHFIPKFKAQGRKGLIKAAILTTVRAQLAIGIFATILTIIFSKQIITYYLSRKTAIPSFDVALAVIIIGAVSAVIDCLSGISVFSVLGFQEQKLYSFLNTIKMGSVLAVSAVMIFIFGIKNALVPAIAYLVTPLIIFLIYSYFLFKKIFPEFFRVKAQFSRKLFLSIFRYALPLAASSIGIIILISVDGICLTYFAGLEQVGIYKNAVVPTVNLIMYLPAAITAVLFPMFSELWEKRKKRVIGEGILKVVKYSLLIILPLAVFISIFPTVILNLLWTSKNIIGANALRILSFGIIFYTIFVIFSSFIRASGDSVTPMKIIYVSALLNLVGDIILIPRLGMSGAAITTTLAFIIQAIIAGSIASKRLQISLEWKNIFLNTLAALISIFGIFLVKNLFENTILKLAISALTYFGSYLILITLLGILNIKELKEFKKLVTGNEV